MLTRNQLAFGLLLALVGCKAECTTTSNDDGSGGSGGEATGAGGQGGAGGEATGAGGQGGVSNGSGGGGGAGGGVECVGHTGLGTAETACDELAGGLMTCPSTMEAPPANPLCHRGFELFTEGARENLLACLDALGIDLAEVCDEPAATDNVGACINEMYTEACENADTVAFCDSIATQCNDAGDPGFDAAGCKADLNPFSEAGHTEYLNCANNAPVEVLCADIHAYCYAEVFVY